MTPHDEGFEALVTPTVAQVSTWEARTMALDWNWGARLGH